MRKVSVNAPCRKIRNVGLENSSENLELESRLITHWHAIEDVAWRAAAVSLGAFRNVSKRPRVEDPCGHGRCQRPLFVRIGRYGQDGTVLHGDWRRRWRLVNPQ